MLEGGLEVHQIDVLHRSIGVRSYGSNGGIMVSACIERMCDWMY